MGWCVSFNCKSGKQTSVSSVCSFVEALNVSGYEFHEFLVPSALTVVLPGALNPFGGAVQKHVTSLGLSCSKKQWWMWMHLSRSNVTGSWHWMLRNFVGVHEIHRMSLWNLPIALQAVTICSFHPLLWCFGFLMVASSPLQWGEPHRVSLTKFVLFTNWHKRYCKALTLSRHCWRSEVPCHLLV